MSSMKNIVAFSILFLLVTSSLAGSVEMVESPKACEKCGMDRIAFAQSRMLVIYADGTSVGVCSLHCAAEELQQNKGKQIRSLLVADYPTQALLEAKTATWVVGGKKQGVMTVLAKWAFARTEDARRFRKENGGRVKSFAQALKAATLEVAGRAAQEKAVEREMLREMR